MIDRDHKLPLARQAKAVGISRGSIYYRPRPVGEAGLGLMRRIDELHLSIEREVAHAFLCISGAARLNGAFHCPVQSSTDARAALAAREPTMLMEGCESDERQ